MRKHYSRVCAVMLGTIERVGSVAVSVVLGERRQGRASLVLSPLLKSIALPCPQERAGRSMSKFFRQLPFLLSLFTLLGLSSCQQDHLEAPTLSVNLDRELLISGSGEEVTLPITTNQSAWKAITSASWLKLREAGNILIIEALANPQVQERLASILIVAGGKELQVGVKQLVDKSNAITLDPNEIHAPRGAQEYRVRVKASSDQWTVTKEPADASWVTLLPRPRYGELIVNLDENKGKGARVCSLKIQAGNASTTLVITQDGMPHFFLPYMVWESNLEEAEAFEEQRNSRITMRPREADPIQGIRAVSYFQFSTVSSAFQQVRYEYVNLGTRFLYKATLVAQDLSAINKAELLDFLAKEQYTKRTDIKSTETSQFFVNEQKKVHLQYSTDDAAKEAYLIFTPIVEQSGSYQVPEALPLGFPFVAGGTKAQVEQWESEMKGEKSNDLTQALGMLAYFAHAPYFTRYYLFKEDNPNLLDAVNFTLDPKYQGMYKYGGLHFMGREFDALIKSSGFVYHSYDQRRGAHFYINETKNLRLAVNMIRMANLELTRCQVTIYKP